MNLAEKIQTSRAEPVESSQRFLNFTLLARQFAIPLLEVKEVIGLQELTPIPQSPPHFKGIINLRGQVISIIDLRSKFKMGEADVASKETTIIIMDLSPLSLGVIVDSVDCVSTYEAGDVSAPPDVDSNLKSDFIIGVAREEKRMTLILDIRAALSIHDYKAIKEQNQKAA